MRVLVLNHNVAERGTYFRARNVAEGLHRRGHDVTFVCGSHRWYRSEVIEDRRRWRHWQSPSWAPLHFEEGHSPLGLMHRALRLRRRWDLVYTFSHFPVDQGTARLLGRSTAFWMTDWCDLWNSREGGLHDWRLWSRPLPAYMHGWRGAVARWHFRLEDEMELAAVRDADAVSIIASPLRGWTDRLEIPPRKVLHLASGADTTNIHVMDREECRHRLGIHLQRPVACYVANITPDNRQLERALIQVWEKEPSLLVLSIGPHWSEPKGVLADAIRHGRLIDCGRKAFAEVPAYLGAADFLLMPVRNTPFNRCRWPNKFGDYIASGRPIATVRVGDMGRAVEKYDLGVAGEPSPEGLAEAMMELLRDPERRVRLGEKAREAAEGPFSWNRKIARLVRFLRRHGLPA